MKNSWWLFAEGTKVISTSLLAYKNISCQQNSYSSCYKVQDPELNPTILLSLSSKLPLEMVQFCSSCSSVPSSKGVPPVAMMNNQNLQKTTKYSYTANRNIYNFNQTF